MNNWRRYAQLVGPLVGSVVMVAIIAYRGAAEDNTVTGPEWVLLVTQVLMTASVWGAANVRGWEQGKKWQAMVFAVLALLASVVTNGITGDELMQLVVTGLSALGVVVAPPTPLPSQPVASQGGTTYRSGRAG